jgi:TonB family protein
LRGAIYIETYGPFDGRPDREIRDRFAEVDRIALENTAHVFHFSNEAALAIPFRYSDVCPAVAQGFYAGVADIAGQTIPTFSITGPGMDWSSCPSAPYPLETKLSDEGVTSISLLVGADGTLRESKIKESSGSAILDEAIRTVLLACKFRPQTIDGKPARQPVWMVVRIGNQAPWPFVK